MSLVIFSHLLNVLTKYDLNQIIGFWVGVSSKTRRLTEQSFYRTNVVIYRISTTKMFSQTVARLSV